MSKINRQAFHKEHDKKLKALWFEHQKVSEALRNMGYIELDVPIRSGYDRFFVLRKDAYNRKDADVLERLLKLINVTVHSRDKKYTKKDWKTKKIVPVQQHPKILDKPEYEKLNEQERSYFEVSYDFDKRRWKYMFKYPYLLTFKIVNHYITKVRQIDPVLESRKKELDQLIYENGYNYGRLAKIFGWHGYPRFDKYTPEESRATEQLKDMLKNS